MHSDGNRYAVKPQSRHLYLLQGLAAPHKGEKEEKENGKGGREKRRN